MTPPPENVALIYNLEKVAELAFKTYFESRGITAFAGSLLIPSSGNDATDAANVALGYNLIDFQKDRPRVEIFANLGAGQGRFIPHPQYPLVECETQWAIGFSVLIVTAADMLIHAAYRTNIRYQIHAARGSINGVAPLANHYLAQFADEGTSPVEKPEEGVFQTRINFSSLISVQSDAWALLAT